GWTLEYLFISGANKFQGQTAQGIQNIFDQFQESGWRPIMWSFVFMAMSAGVVMAGIEKGIEKYTKLLMPILFILIMVLCIRSLTLPGGMQGIEFLFKPDFSKIDTGTVLEALGQAFFSLSIGMGTLITYGSYIKKKDNLGSSAVSVAFADTMIAVLAGVAIFPAVFAFGISPAAGPDLVFITLPNIFIKMQGGYFFAIMFFFLLVVAALTSSISILEVAVAYLSEELKINRKKATIIASSFIMLLSVFCSLSLVKVPSLKLFGMNLFDVFDKFSANILLPLGGFFIVLFVAFFFGTNKLKKELSSNGNYKLWYYWPFLIIIRFIAPLAIALVFLNGLGILKF
ncbi:MAG: sodium-dependent transporter, partial [Prolixibacteraceae bacterium]|nr:sodium-dependent transporter [Prolixibacteraceae bacterium]